MKYIISQVANYQSAIYCRPPGCAVFQFRPKKSTQKIELIDRTKRVGIAPIFKHF